MGQHDDYGKRLLKRIAGDAFEQYGPAVTVDYGPGLGGQLDGVVAGQIAVEIESRVSKQIRGAVLDLICHPSKRKLLVILPVHAPNPSLTAEQCRHILRQFVEPENFRVVVTYGNGDDDRMSEDVAIVGAALRELGFANGA